MRATEMLGVLKDAHTNLQLCHGLIAKSGLNTRFEAVRELESGIAKVERVIDELENPKLT